MSEQVILDPDEEIDDRYEFDISDLIGKDGIDWGDAAVEPYKADVERGSIQVDYRIPNRVVTIPLRIKDEEGGLTFFEARRALQQKAALFQDEGGIIKRVASDGGVQYGIVETATLSLSGGWQQAHRDVDADGHLIVETLPDFMGPEETLDTITVTTQNFIASKLKKSAVDAIIKGDYPGRFRLTVSEGSSKDRKGMFGALRSRHYDSASTAALVYEAEALTAVDGANGSLTDGSSGVLFNTSPAIWSTMFNTNILSGGALLTHVGTYEVLLRSYASASGAKFRFTYDVGDLILPSVNDIVDVPIGYQVISLGQITLRRAPIGTHGWSGAVQVLGNGAANVAVDKFVLKPLDEAAWRAAAETTLDLGLGTYIAYDPFDQSAGALSAKTAPKGGHWGEFGDPDDITVSGIGTAVRTALSDTAGGNIKNGQVCVLDGSSTIAVGTFSTKITVPASSNGLTGLVMSFVDINNFIAVLVNNGAAGPALYFAKVKAGAMTIQPGNQIIFQPISVATPMIVKASKTAAGLLTGSVEIPGVIGEQSFSFSDADFATGGTLDDGKIGIMDYWPEAVAASRTFYEYSAGVTLTNAVLFSGQDAEIRTDGVFREAATTSLLSELIVDGDLPRIPPSGLEERPVELLFSLSRGNYDDQQDIIGPDSCSLVPKYRPSYMTVASA